MSPSTRRITLGGLLVSIIFCLVSLPEAAFGIEVEDAVMCSGVQARQPMAPADSFPMETGRIWCWSKIRDGQGTTIKHIYYHQDKQIAVVELAIHSPLFRTFSSKLISADGAGPWRVDIVDANGNTLKTLNFTMGSAATPEQSAPAARQDSPSEEQAPVAQEHE